MSGAPPIPGPVDPWRFGPHCDRRRCCRDRGGPCRGLAGDLPRPSAAGAARRPLVERRTEQWQETIRSRAADVRVAADPGGHVGGFVATGPSRDGDAADSVGELFAIYLHPRLWHQGLGSRLHAAATKALAGRFVEATLWVLDGNTRARAFYERKLWQPDGSVKQDTVGDVAVHEIRYRRPLDDPGG